MSENENCRSRCSQCPLADRPTVFGTGKHGGLAIVGEAPGQNEARKGIPFVGISGQLLRKTLHAAGLNPKDAYITNAVACHPPGNKTPTSAHIRTCQWNLFKELAEVRPTKVLTVGASAMQAVTRHAFKSMSKARGLGMWVDLPIPQACDHFFRVGTGSTVCINCRMDEKDHKLENLETYRVFLIPTYHPAFILRDPDVFREYAQDVQKILRQDAPLDPPEIDTWIPRTREEALEALDYIAQASTLSLDTETTSLDPLRARMISIGFGALGAAPSRSLSETHSSLPVGASVIIPKEIVYDPVIREAVRQICAGEFHAQPGGQKFPFHNVKYDHQVLTMYGAPVTHPGVTDTQMLAYALDERPGRRYQGRSLKTLARVYCDIPDYAFNFDALYDALDRGEDVDADWEALYQYHGMDCYMTAYFHDMFTRMCEEDSPKLCELVQNILVPACLTFADIELRGMQLDIPYLETLRVQYARDLEELKQTMTQAWEHYVQDKGKVVEFNPGSHPQVKKLLNEGLGLGVENTQRDPLIFAKTRLKPEDPRRPIIDAVIQYRLKSKVISTYIDGMIKRADADGRAHADYMIDGTATGRTSCGNPNLQNIPAIMGSQIRHAFTATPGMMLINADYSQLQLRIAAWYSKDVTLTRVYTEGGDIHNEVAAKLFRKAIHEVKKEDRFWAKRIDFGVLFGRSAQAIIDGAEVAEHIERGGTPWTLKEAQFFLDEFWNGFPELKAWCDALKKSGLENKFVEDMMGRRRRFPFIAGGSDRGHVERQCVNTPIQAGEAEILLYGIANLHRALRERLPGKAFIVLSVHDSITLECYPEVKQEVYQIIKETLEVPPFESSIQFRVDAEEGYRWSEMKEYDDAAVFAGDEG